MKFCKNLQRVVDISDPEWAPYWTNYKMLKKLIKQLPSLVPVDENSKQCTAKKGTTVQQPQHARSALKENSRPDSPSSVASAASSVSAPHQNHGDKTAEEASTAIRPCAKQGCDSVALDQSIAETEALETNTLPSDPAVVVNMDMQKQAIGKSPGEVAFFKLLHSELKKAVHFFERAQQEFSIREERIREGMEIMKKPNSIMVSEKWSLLAKSLYRLYKDLLLLETFAIMTYCSFSKILKKHDKVTGYDTRIAFMDNVVNKANFKDYPKVLAMISRCESLYEEVSQHLMSEGKEGLCEDERLFINMIHRLNAQVMDTREAEGAPDLEKNKSKRSATLTSSIGRGSSTSRATSSVATSCRVTSSLRSLVEENDAMAEAAQVSGALSDDDAEDCAKRRTVADTPSKGGCMKRSASPESDLHLHTSKRARTE